MTENEVPEGYVRVDTITPAQMQVALQTLGDKTIDEMVALKKGELRVFLAVKRMMNPIRKVKAKRKLKKPTAIGQAK